MKDLSLHQLNLIKLDAKKDAVDALGVDAATLNGKSINDSQQTLSNLWTAHKTHAEITNLKNQINSQLTDYLPLSGGTLTGGIKLPSNLWYEKTSYGIHMNNSDLIGINSLIFNDDSNSKIEGVCFPKTNIDTTLPFSDTDYDIIKALDGVLTFNNKRVYHELSKPTPAEIGAASASHTHSYLPLSGGALTGGINLNIGGRNGYMIKVAPGDSNGSAVGFGAGGLTVMGSGESMGIFMDNLPTGLTYGTEKLVLLSDTDVDIYSGFQDGISVSKKSTISRTGDLTMAGTITGTKVYNAVYNDYAEWFERENLKETLEPGDVVIWNKTGVTKTNIEEDSRVIGVYSDSYGHIVGGEKLENMEDNINKFIPVGLTGRVNVKVVGNIKTGDLLCTSNIPGVAKKSNSKEIGTIIGKAISCHKGEQIGKIKMLILNT